MTSTLPPAAVDLLGAGPEAMIDAVTAIAILLLIALLALRQVAVAFGTLRARILARGTEPAIVALVVAGGTNFLIRVADLLRG